MSIDIGLDLGNSQTKCIADGGNRILFKSLYLDGFNTLSEYNRTGIHKVVYDDRLLSIGTGITNLNKTKYLSEEYKIMLLMAIHLATSKKEKVIKANLVTGLPIDLFKNKKLLEKIKKHIEGFESEVIEVDGLKKTITIERCEIWAESGINPNNFENFKNRRILILDIGGFTIDCMEFLKGDINNNHTIRKGVLLLKQNIYKLFNENTGVVLDEEGINELFESVLKNSTYKIDGKDFPLGKYIRQVRAWTSNIFEELQKVFGLDDKEIIAIGGGSFDLRNYLERYMEDYNLTIEERALFLNAETFLEYAKKISAKAEKKTEKENE